jgi:hypothetical protein
MFFASHNSTLGDIGEQGIKKVFTKGKNFLIGCRALMGVSVTDLSKETNMSRQHIYDQKVKAQEYIEMMDTVPEEVKMIKLNDSMIRRAIVSLMLDCHSTTEGVQRFFESVLGERISAGHISGVLKEAAERAKKFDDSIDLGGIRQGANDEIFQRNTPILTGIDPETTYSYLLEEAGDRTADTWELFMQDRKDHGLNLEVSISDAGTGLMAGIPRAYPEIKIQSDVFHALRSIGIEISKAERKAYKLIGEEAELKERACGKRPQKRTKEKLEDIGPKVKESIRFYDTLNILFEWLRELASFTGYTYDEAEGLIKYVIQEMEAVAKAYPALLKEAQKFSGSLPSLLSFISRLEEEMEKRAEEQGIPLEAFHLMYRQLRYGETSEVYDQIEYKLVLLMMSEYSRARKEFWEILGRVKKASSLVENINGRIRPYMNIKRIVPASFFPLMKVYFNTRRYKRSRCIERIGKSPLELLKNGKQPDFFEAIGF